MVVCGAQHREVRDEREYSGPVGSVRIHPGCAALNDTNDFSIFLSFDISHASDTFVGAPNCACTRRGESQQAGMKDRM